MLIEVKSQQAQDADPKGGKRFEFNTAERLTRLPAYFALFVLSIAAYIRSIVSVQASAPEMRGRERDQDGDAAPKAQGTAQLTNLNATGVDELETGCIGEGDGWKGPGVEPGNPWPTSFVVPDFPQFHFVEPRFQTSGTQVFSPAALMGFPVNDNIGTRTAATPNPSAPVAAGAPPNNDTGPEEPEDDDDGGTRPGNRAPVVMGPVRLNDVFAGQVVLIGLVHLLRGAFDPDADALSIENVTIRGAELVASDGGWLLQTRPGMVGPVHISYRITDGQAWVNQEAMLDIVRKVMVMGNDDDLIVGSPWDDDICGNGGNDLIDALDGNDHVDGGEGDDHINGGTGDDVLIGGLGNDVIFAGSGDDIVYGGAGNDRLFGEDGDDTIFGEDGDDIIEGGAGRDHLVGGTGTDSLFGGEGDDLLIGGGGHDLLDGGAGNDLLEGGAGDDLLKGGAGNDVLVDGDGDDEVFGEAGNDILVADAGDDTMDGGEGYDTLDYSAALDGVVVDMVGGTSYSSELGTDSIANVEAVMGGAGNDMIVVGGKATVLSGGRGKDTFVFEVTDVNPTLSDDVVHKILDFVVGDRVRVRDYDMDRDARRAEKDMFEAIYGDDDDDWLKSDVPIQVRHETIDDENWTIIVADLNGDNIYDLAVSIQGVTLLPPDTLT